MLRRTASVRRACAFRGLSPAPIAVANTFYDPEFNETFRAFGCSTCNQDAKWWNGGEPLWVTAENQVRRAPH